MSVAIIDYGSGNLHSAAKAFERLEKLNPNPAIAAYNQARVAAKEAHYESALEKLDQYFAARETAASLGPYELLERVLKELGRSDELLPRLEKLDEEQPGDIPLVDRGICFFRVKAQNAQRAGARALVVYESVETRRGCARSLPRPVRAR